jgi:hypothetical protein
LTRSLISWVRIFFFDRNFMATFSRVSLCFATGWMSRVVG